MILLTLVKEHTHKFAFYELIFDDLHIRTLFVMKLGSFLEIQFRNVVTQIKEDV